MIALVVASLVTGVAVALLLPVLRRHQVMDLPNARSSHTVAVPRGGGIGVAVGVFAAVVAVALAGDSIPWAVLLAAGAMALVGFVDDLGGLANRVRFAAQLAAGLLLSVWLVLDSPAAGWPGVAFCAVTVVGFAAFVNAFNFMDGVNGISAFTGLVAGGWYVWIGRELDLGALVILGASTAGACLGFLPWNVPRARVFLGDTGSYALGALLVSSALYAWANNAGILVSSAPLVVYLADTAWTLMDRARRGVALGEAHRDHVYQRLHQLGLSHVVTSLVVAGIAAVACLVAWLAPPVIALTLIALMLVGYLTLPRVLVPLGVGRG